MDGPIRKNLIHQIDVFVKKYPLASAKDVKRFILSGSCVDLKKVSKNTLKQFIFYHMMKIKKTGSCLERVHGSGRPKSVTGKKQNVTKVLKLDRTINLENIPLTDILLTKLQDFLYYFSLLIFIDFLFYIIHFSKLFINPKMTLFFKTSFSIFSLRFWTLEHKIKSV